MDHFNEGGSNLRDIGVEFRDDNEALDLWRQAGARVEGERVRMPAELARGILSTAPREFIQHARNPDRNVVIGGAHLVLAPAYGAPFVNDLDRGRRYTTIEDFRNIVKPAYLLPHLHHSDGTVCEPVDVPVNKRHLDMVDAHIRYSDKPFMGSVTASERAENSVRMAEIVFGTDFVADHAVLINLINGNSPLVFDTAMLGALKVYAHHNQANIVAPFILQGAMRPVAIAGTLVQLLAEGLAGITFMQLVRPGRRSSSARLSPPSRSSRGRAPWGRLGPLSSPSRRVSSPAVWGSSSARARSSPRRRRPTPKPGMRAPIPSSPAAWPASIFCSTPPASWRRASRSHSRCSSWTWTSAARSTY